MHWGLIVFLVLVALFAFLITTNMQRIRALIEAFKLFYSEVSFEMTKVVWPSQNEIVNSTVVVIVVGVVLTLGLMSVDFVLGHLTSLLFKG